MRRLNNILITGGAGFIGSNFIRYIFENTGFTGKIYNLDKLTYAGNPGNLEDIEAGYKERYQFIHGDICDGNLLSEIFKNNDIDTVIHFAAESHVDRSISGPADFIRTNINGTFMLLETARKEWGEREDVLFHHISTDEVYGSLGAEGLFHETTAYDPRSPYSASKASSDHLVNAYFHTYNLPVTMSNCSNNYGYYHFPEKLIPLMILNAMEAKALPVYGDGLNVRDWLFVEDHCSAIWTIINSGKNGETYNVGGECEEANINIVKKICTQLEELLPAESNPVMKSAAVYKYEDLITYVKDRPGHDRRYAIDCNKLKNELKWKQKTDFDMGLKKTVEWYLSNMEWVNKVRSGEYQNWLDKNYNKRG